MNLKSLLVIVKMSIPSILGLKKILFVDGKFNPSRAFWLLLFMLVIITSINYIGIDGTNDAINLLDDVSDIIGQSD